MLTMPTDLNRNKSIINKKFPSLSLNDVLLLIKKNKSLKCYLAYRDNSQQFLQIKKINEAMIGDGLRIENRLFHCDLQAADDLYQRNYVQCMDNQNKLTEKLKLSLSAYRIAMIDGCCHRSYMNRSKLKPIHQHVYTSAQRNKVPTSFQRDKIPTRSMLEVLSPMAHVHKFDFNLRTILPCFCAAANTQENGKSPLYNFKKDNQFLVKSLVSNACCENDLSKYNTVKVNDTRVLSGNNNNLQHIINNQLVGRKTSPEEISSSKEYNTFRSQNLTSKQITNLNNDDSLISLVNDITDRCSNYPLINAVHSTSEHEKCIILATMENVDDQQINGDNFFHNENYMNKPSKVEHIDQLSSSVVSRQDENVGDSCCKRRLICNMTEETKQTSHLLNVNGLIKLKDSDFMLNRMTTVCNMNKISNEINNAKEIERPQNENVKLTALTDLVDINLRVNKTEHNDEKDESGNVDTYLQNDAFEKSLKLQDYEKFTSNDGIFVANSVQPYEQYPSVVSSMGYSVVIENPSSIYVDTANQDAISEKGLVTGKIQDDNQTEYYLGRFVNDSKITNQQFSNIVLTKQINDDDITNDNQPILVMDNCVNNETAGKRRGKTDHIPVKEHHKSIEMHSSDLSWTVDDDHISIGNTLTAKLIKYCRSLPITTLLETPGNTVLAEWPALELSASDLSSDSGEATSQEWPLASETIGSCIDQLTFKKYDHCPYCPLHEYTGKRRKCRELMVHDHSAKFVKALISISQHQTSDNKSHSLQISDNIQDYNLTDTPDCNEPKYTTVRIPVTNTKGNSQRNNQNLVALSEICNESLHHDDNTLKHRSSGVLKDSQLLNQMVYHNLDCRTTKTTSEKRNINQCKHLHPASSIDIVTDNEQSCDDKGKIDIRQSNSNQIEHSPYNGFKNLCMPSPIKIAVETRGNCEAVDERYLVPNEINNPQLYRNGFKSPKLSMRAARNTSVKFLSSTINDNAGSNNSSVIFSNFCSTRNVFRQVKPGTNCSSLYHCKGPCTFFIGPEYGHSELCVLRLVNGNLLVVGKLNPCISVSPGDVIIQINNTDIARMSIQRLTHFLQNSSYFSLCVGYTSRSNYRKHLIYKPLFNLGHGGIGGNMQFGNPFGGGLTGLAGIGVPLRSGGRSTGGTMVAINETREREKRELSHLNDKFAQYVEKVRFLEAQNRKLHLELEALQNKAGQGSSRIKEMYDVEMQEAKKLIDDTAKDKAMAEVKAQNAENEANNFKKRYQEMMMNRGSDRQQLDTLEQEIAENEAKINLLRRRLADLEDEGRRYKAETQRLLGEISRLTNELNNEVFAKSSLETEKMSLEDELQMLKTIHEAELNDLKTRTNIDVGLDPSQFFRNELSNAIKEIRNEYELANEQQRSDLHNKYMIHYNELIMRYQKPEMDPVQFEQHRIQEEKMRSSLTCARNEVIQMKSRNEELAQRIRDVQSMLNAEKEDSRHMSSLRDQELEELRMKLEQLSKEYEEVSSMKTSLENEISEYRELLEGSTNHDGLRQVVEHIEEEARRLESERGFENMSNIGSGGVSNLSRLNGGLYSSGTAPSYYTARSVTSYTTAGSSSIPKTIVPPSSTVSSTTVSSSSFNRSFGNRDF